MWMLAMSKRRTVQHCTWQCIRIRILSMVRIRIRIRRLPVTVWGAARESGQI